MGLSFTDFNQDVARGDDTTVNFTIKNPAGTAVLNVTGWSFWFTGKVDLNDTDGSAVFQRTTANGGITITDAANGAISVAIRAVDTSPLTADTTVLCDLQGKDAGGKVNTIMTGKINIKREVTQATA